MPRESALPVSFRLPADDRRLVELIAAYQGQSVSDFVRRVVVEAAREMLEREGPDKVLQVVAESNNKLNDQRIELFQQVVDQAASSRS